MAFEYKVVGAPEKGRRRRGARTRSDRVAAAFEEILAAEAVEGWEYLRTDLVPVQEKAGLFSRREDVHRAVMVFRRALRRSTPAEPVVRPGAPRREETDELVLMPEGRTRPRSRRAEPEIRLAHSSDRSSSDDARD